MRNMSRGAGKRRLERKARTNYRVLSVRLRSLNPTPFLQIVRLLKIFEWYRNK